MKIDREKKLNELKELLNSLDDTIFPYMKYEKFNIITSDFTDNEIVEMINNFKKHIKG